MIMLDLKNTIVSTCNSIQHILFPLCQSQSLSSNDNSTVYSAFFPPSALSNPSFFRLQWLSWSFRGASWILCIYLRLRPFIGDTFGWVLTSGDLASRLLSDCIGLAFAFILRASFTISHHHLSFVTISPFSPQLLHTFFILPPSSSRENSYSCGLKSYDTGSWLIGLLVGWLGMLGTHHEQYLISVLLLLRCW